MNVLLYTYIYILYMHMIYDSIAFFYIYISTFVFKMSMMLRKPSHRAVHSQVNTISARWTEMERQYALFMYTPCGKIVY